MPILQNVPPAPPPRPMAPPRASRGAPDVSTRLLPLAVQAVGVVGNVHARHEGAKVLAVDDLGGGGWGEGGGGGGGCSQREATDRLPDSRQPCKTNRVTPAAAECVGSAPEAASGTGPARTLLLVSAIAPIVRPWKAPCWRGARERGPGRWGIDGASSPRAAPGCTQLQSRGAQGNACAVRPTPRLPSHQTR
jgi:hypothetical protein